MAEKGRNREIESFDPIEWSATQARHKGSSSARARAGRGLFEQIYDRWIPSTPLFRVLGYVRPHLWFVFASSFMGILKFSLPLAFPIAFKYVFEVLLVPQPSLERINQVIDRFCLTVAGALHFGTNNAARLDALSLALVVVFVVQAIATYYRSYWARLQATV